MLLALSTNQLACGFLITLVALVLFGFLVLWKSSRLTIGQTFMWTINYLLAKLLWRTRIDGVFPVVRNQGAVIVANHHSSVDPSFIQVSVRRVVYWMVAREYCKTGFAGWLLRKFQVIPVGRAGVDTAAIKLAIRLARKGGLVGMFPEGRINEKRDPLLLPGRPGAALVALKARVPIIPMYIIGSPYDGTTMGALLMPAKVRVIIGKPIDLTPYFAREKEDGVAQEITIHLMREIAKLAGHPEFQPQLAGRRWRLGEEEEADKPSPSLAGEHSGNGQASSAPSARFRRDNFLANRFRRASPLQWRRTWDSYTPPSTGSGFP